MQIFNRHIFLLLIPVIFFSCSRLLIDRAFISREQDWLLFGGSSLRNHVSVNSVKPPLKQVWEYYLKGGVFAQPLIKDSILFVTTLDGEIRALALTTGNEIGYKNFSGSIEVTPLLNSDILIIALASGNYTLLAYNIRDASMWWRKSLGPILCSPVAIADTLFVVTLKGEFIALDRMKGTELFRIVINDEKGGKFFRSSPAVKNDLVFLCTDDGVLYAIDWKLRSIRWKYIAGSSIISSPLIVNNYVFFGETNGVIHCVNQMDGILEWKYDTSSKIYGSGSADNTKIYWGMANGSLVAIDWKIGKKVWDFKTQAIINSAPLISDSLLFVGSLDKTLYVLQKVTGQLIWKKTLNGRIKTTPVIWGKYLIILSDDRKVSAYVPEE